MKLKLVTAKMNTPQDTTVVDFVHFCMIEYIDLKKRPGSDLQNI